MDPVVHFQFPADDRERISAFYTKAFGWKTQTLGPEHGGYVLVSTTETDDLGRPTKPGAINGGFFEKCGEMPDACPSVVIGVEDIHEAMRKVAEAGGNVLGQPIEIPGYGLLASFIDTEGNRVEMMQPNREWLTD